MRLIIDTSVLGKLCNPNSAQSLAESMGRLLRYESDLELLVPQVVDYELRRKLLQLARFDSDQRKQNLAARSLDRLDQVGKGRMRQMTQEVMLRAALKWAELRNAGTPTAHEHSLDIDVIIACHALIEKAEVITTNTRHFERLGVRISPLSTAI